MRRVESDSSILEKVVTESLDEVSGYASERGSNSTFEESVVIL
jgi:hypothetical protein